MVNTHIPTQEELSAMSANQVKALENRLRAAAARQGFRLDKSRTRDPRALDYGSYGLVDSRTDSPAVTFGLLSGYGLSLNDVAWFLLGEQPTIHVADAEDAAPTTFANTNGDPILLYSDESGWALLYEESWCRDMREYYRPVSRAEAGAHPGRLETGLDDANEAISDAQEHLRRIGYRQPR